MKGDFNNNGTVTGADVNGFNNAASAGALLRLREQYLGDFNNNGTVTGADVALFNAYASITATNDCAIPANCPLSFFDLLRSDP